MNENTHNIPDKETSIPHKEFGNHVVACPQCGDHCRLATMTVHRSFLICAACAREEEFTPNRATA